MICSVDRVAVGTRAAALDSASSSAEKGGSGSDSPIEAKSWHCHRRVDLPLLGSGLANSRVDASDRAVEAPVWTPDSGSDCASELARVSPKDLGIVCGVGGPPSKYYPEQQQQHHQHHPGSTDRTESDRGVRPVPVIAMKTPATGAFRTTV